MIVYAVYKEVYGDHDVEVFESEALAKEWASIGDGRVIEATLGDQAYLDNLMKRRY